MKAFTRHTGVAAPLLHNNIDTDTIIPSVEMKRVSKAGLSEGLFAGWRYKAPGTRELNPDFVLNREDTRGASILLGGSNFGCGSSREHAVWALWEYGIRAIVAPSFGSIFRGNCVRNGILPIELSEANVHALAQQVDLSPVDRPITIDLEALHIVDADGGEIPFEIPAGDRQLLLDGLDSIALTMQQAPVIDAWEAQDRQRRPWIYL